MKLSKLLKYTFLLNLVSLTSPSLAYAQLGTGNPGECSTSQLRTAIGCINFQDINVFTSFLLQWLIGFGGGVALILLIVASYRIMTSQGDPRRLQGAQELFTSALAGLILLVFSIFLLRVLGVDVLGLF